MYTYTEQSKRTGLGDVLLIAAGVVALILLDRFVTVYIDGNVTNSNVASALLLCVKSLFVLGIIGMCAIVYIKLLRNYRYTFVTEESDRFAQGTLFIEICVSDRGSTVFEVAPEERRELISAGQPFPEKYDGARTKHFATQKTALCDSLYIERDGKLYRLLIASDEQLSALLRGEGTSAE